MEWHSPGFQVVFHCAEPHEGEEFCEVWAYAGIQEIVGRKHDGESVWSGFDFDVLAFLTDFQPEDVAVSSRQPAHPSELILEGNFRGTGVFLHVCLEPPDEEHKRLMKSINAR